MKKLNIYDLGKEDLIKLKVDIDIHIAELSRREQEESLNSIKSFSKLSEMKRGGKILCVQFYNHKVYQHDFVDISFSKWEDEWVSYSSSHKTLPMGCSSSVRREDMEGHCFLVSFYGTNWYFFTLKPESIKEDLKKECDKFFKRKLKQQEKEWRETQLELDRLYSLSDEMIEKIKIHL
jgi:hypothetical protein